MVLTKKKSFSGNGNNTNKSRKINRVSQEGGERTPEQKTLTKNVAQDKEYKSENRLNLFIGFNEYYEINEKKYLKKLNSGDFYIRKEKDGLFLKKFNETNENKYGIKSLQELSNEINSVPNPNILNSKLSLREGGLPICLVNEFRVYQMTINDIQNIFLKKISRYLTDVRKNRFLGGAESEESHLVKALNSLLSIENLDETSNASVKRIVDKLIEKMFSAIDKSYPEGEDEEFENKIQDIFTKYLDEFLRNVKESDKEVKNFLLEQFSKDTLKRKLKERVDFQDKTANTIRREANLKEQEKFHSEFLQQEGNSEVKNLFRNFYTIINCISFYVRKAFEYTESELEERHQSYMVLVIYESNLVNLITQVVKTFEFLRDSIYDEIEGEDSKSKSKESIFYDIITKNFIRLKKSNYGDIGTGDKDKDVAVSAIEFYSASRKVSVSTIIEFIKMLIEYTISKNTELEESQGVGITYQLINKLEEEAKKDDDKK